MATTNRDLDRAADAVLTLYLGEVDALVLGWGLEKTTLLSRQWLYNVLVVEEAHRLVETADRVDGDAFDQCRFVGGFGRHNEAALADFLC